ncbi:MAG: hypothetical protein JXR76_24350 [Deltaproteobacteria bacterium]|nr:hypothetical protein [Deltaproteobacteria bacterium]
MEIWRGRGKTKWGLDMIAELGAIGSLGVSGNGATDSRVTHFAFGGQTCGWIRSGKPDNQLEITFSAGWLRGLNAFAATRKLGGFHGLFFSIGFAWSHRVR